MYKFKDKETSVLDDFLNSESEDDFLVRRETELLRSESAKRMEHHGATTVRILKAVFLFAPGAIYLYMGTFQVLVFEFLHDFYSPLLIFAIGAFMTIFGIGSLRNPKDIAIPISIVLMALCFYAVCAILGNPMAVFTYGVYLLPLVFALPFVVRSGAWNHAEKEF